MKECIRHMRSRARNTGTWLLCFIFSQAPMYIEDYIIKTHTFQWLK